MYLNSHGHPLGAQSRSYGLCMSEQAIALHLQLAMQILIERGRRFQHIRVARVPPGLLHNVRLYTRLFSGLAVAADQGHVNVVQRCLGGPDHRTHDHRYRGRLQLHADFHALVLSGRARADRQRLRDEVVFLHHEFAVVVDDRDGAGKDVAAIVGMLLGGSLKIIQEISNPERSS